MVEIGHEIVFFSSSLSSVYFRGGIFIQNTTLSLNFCSLFGRREGNHKKKKDKRDGRKGKKECRREENYRNKPFLL